MTPRVVTRTAHPMPGAIGFEDTDHELYLALPDDDASLEPYVRHLAPGALLSIDGPHHGYPVEDVIRAIVDYRQRWPRHLSAADQEVADRAAHLLVTMASLGVYAQADRDREVHP